MAERPASLKKVTNRDCGLVELERGNETCSSAAYEIKSWMVRDGTELGRLGYRQDDGFSDCTDPEE